VQQKYTAYKLLYYEQNLHNIPKFALQSPTMQCYGHREITAKDMEDIDAVFGIAY